MSDLEEDELVKCQIMYIEPKVDVASLEARIAKICFSNSGKTLRYRGREFTSLNGSGFKANYFDVETGQEYWISGCRKDGNDGLYRTKVFIDEDVREEYWVSIRGMPDRKDQSSFVSIGKHQKSTKQPKNAFKNV